MIVPFIQYAFGLLAWSALSLGIGYVWFPLFAKFVDARLAWPLCRLLAVPFTTLIVLWPSLFVPVQVGPVASLIGLALIGFAARRLAGLTSSELHAHLRAARPFHFEAGVAMAAAVFLVAIFFIPNMAPGGERLHDGAIWATLSVQGTYPFVHPWMAGIVVPYYFLGYLTLYQIFQFIALPPVMTYNLALATAPVSYALALWIFFTVAWEKRRLAVLGSAAVVLSSNLKSVEQAWAAIVAGTPYQFWDSSRVVANTINEFPLWTVTFGDLHPHLMSLWLVPAAMAIGLAAMRNKLCPAPQPQRPVLALTGAAILALTLGMHTWDVPLVIVFFGGAFLFSAPRFAFHADKKWIAIGAALAALLAAPYLRHMAGAPKSFGWVTQRSNVFEFLEVWGLFFAPLITLAFLRLYRRQERDLLTVLALALPVAILFQSSLLLIATMMAIVGAAFFLGRTDHVLRSLTLGALGLCLGCELVYLKDAFGGENVRLNTVFKIYMPAWTMLGCAAAIALRTLRNELPANWFRPGMALWGIAASAYLFAGLPTRLNVTRLPASLDGYGELRRVSADEEQVLRWMTQESRTPGFWGTVLVALDGAYRWPGHVASFTGYPLYTAWENYSYWFHFPALRDEHFRRAKITKQIFDGSFFTETDGCPQVKEKLAAEKIDYLFLGTHERRIGAEAAIRRLEGCLPPLFAAGNVKFLGIRPQPL